MKSTDSKSTDNRPTFFENRPIVIRQSNKTCALKQGMMQELLTGRIRLV